MTCQELHVSLTLFSEEPAFLEKCKGEDVAVYGGMGIISVCEARKSMVVTLFELFAVYGIQVVVKKTGKYVML